MTDVKLPQDVQDLLQQLVWQVWYMRCECDLSKPLSKQSHEAATDLVDKRARALFDKYGVRMP